MATNRDLLKHAIWLGLEFTLARYLIANCRNDGAEKAERHFEMCSYVLAVAKRLPIDNIRVTHGDLEETLHKATRQITDHMNDLGMSEEDVKILFNRLWPYFNVFILSMNEEK